MCYDVITPDSCLFSTNARVNVPERFLVCLASLRFHSLHCFCACVCVFQAVGFSCIPSSKDEDGLVVLVLNKKEVDVRSQQQQLVESLHKVLGGNPTLTVNVEGVKALPDDQSVSTSPHLTLSFICFSHRITNTTVLIISSSSSSSGLYFHDRAVTCYRFYRNSSSAGTRTSNTPGMTPRSGKYTS